MRDIVDLDAYPLDRPGSPDWLTLVERSQLDLQSTGMFNLPGFLRGAARRTAAAELTPRFATEAFTHARRHNIYFRKSVPEVPADHPALAEVETISRTLCGDQIGGAIERLYEWQPFRDFLAATMGKPRLFTMDDPLARVNAMAYSAGGGLNWHFDRSEFTTTLLLQAPQAGGAFEYRTDLRTADDPNFDGVARLLRGEDPEKQSIRLDPGTLNVFRGKNTAHRVTPVEGPTDRIVVVFSFYDRPGVVFSPEERIGFYGRAA